MERGVFLGVALFGASMLPGCGGNATKPVSLIVATTASLVDGTARAQSETSAEPEEAARLVSEHEQSRLARQAFCRQHGLSSKTLDNTQQLWLWLGNRVRGLSGSLETEGKITMKRFSLGRGMGQLYSFLSFNSPNPAAMGARGGSQRLLSASIWGCLLRPYYRFPCKAWLRQP